MRFPTWLYFLATTLSLASLAFAASHENTLSWQSSATPHSPDYSGSWKGRWTSSPQLNRHRHIRRGHGGRGHGGTLRVRLQRLDSRGGRPAYKGTFAGRFAVIIPYFYRTTVYQEGNQLYADKRLGAFGSYKMHLSSSHGRMHGRWQAGKQHGTIRLARTRR